MKSTQSLRSMLLATVAATLLSSPAYAANYFESPSLYEQVEGNIVYVTGGIGESELNELTLVKNEYNVHLTNTDKSGAYVSDTSIVIQDRKGNDMIATNTGPLLYATLPAGRYKLLAENSGLMQQKSFTVGAKKSANLNLTWNLPD